MFFFCLLPIKGWGAQGEEDILPAGQFRANLKVVSLHSDPWNYFVRFDETETVGQLIQRLKNESVLHADGTYKAKTYAQPYHAASVLISTLRPALEGERVTFYEQKAS